VEPTSKVVWAFPKPPGPAENIGDRVLLSMVMDLFRGAGPIGVCCVDKANVKFNRSPQCFELRLQLSRPIRLSRSPDEHGLNRNRVSLTLAGSGSFQASHSGCMAGIARAESATFTLSDLGGETRMGSSMDTAMMPAITWRPLA